MRTQAGRSSAVLSARLPVNLIGSPIIYANCLIGSPITLQSTGQVHAFSLEHFSYAYCGRTEAPGDRKIGWKGGSGSYDRGRGGDSALYGVRHLPASNLPHHQKSEYDNTRGYAQALGPASTKWLVNERL